MRRIEVVPQRAENGDPYVWVMPREADWFAVYERDEDGMAVHLIDVPDYEAARAYVRHCLGVREHFTWYGHGLGFL